MPSNVPSVGARLKITSELGLWDRGKFDARTGYVWPGVSESAVPLPLVTRGDEKIEQLVVGTVIVVEEVLLDSPAPAGRYQAVLGKVEGDGSRGIVWTIYEGKSYAEPVQPAQPKAQPNPPSVKVVAGKPTLACVRVGPSGTVTGCQSAVPVSQTGKVYEITKSIYAFSATDYAFPQAQSPAEVAAVGQYRGGSKTPLFTLSPGDLVRVDRIVNHVADGHETRKPYEIVRISPFILCQESATKSAANDYIAWLLYEGIESARLADFWVPAPGSATFSVRPARLPKFHVDGKTALAAIAESLRTASKRVLISGWWLSLYLKLERPNSETLQQLLEGCHARKVDVAVLIWSSFRLAFQTHDAWVHDQLASIGVTDVQTYRRVVSYTHHQKFVVADDYVYMGGIDLCRGRWDDANHRLDGTDWAAVDDFYSPTLRDESAAEWSIIERRSDDRTGAKTLPRMPWHDVHVEFGGPAVADVVENFADCWSGTAPAAAAPGNSGPQAFPAPCNAIQIVRSLTANNRRQVGEMSIQLAYQQAIAQALHSIHIEQQFFTSGAPGPANVENGIARALTDRILRAIDANQKFRVSIVLPLHPEGMLARAGDPLQIPPTIEAILHWQLATIRGMTQVIGNRIAEVKSGQNVSDYINFFYLLKHEAMLGSTFAQQIYVHAKTMIVDDRIAIIGSANINDRSMLADRDNEIAAVILAGDFVDVQMNGQSFPGRDFAHSLRLQLWMEHLGTTDPSGARDPVKGYDTLLTTAQSNAAIFERVFPTLPRNDSKTWTWVGQNNAPFTASGNVADLSGVQGHIVNYPIRWLEGYVPPGRRLEPWEDLYTLKPPEESSTA